MDGSRRSLRPATRMSAARLLREGELGDQSQLVAEPLPLPAVRLPRLGKRQCLRLAVPEVVGPDKVAPRGRANAPALIAAATSASC